MIGYQKNSQWDGIEHQLQVETVEPFPIWGIAIGCIIGVVSAVMTGGIIGIWFLRRKYRFPGGKTGRHASKISLGPMFSNLPAHPQPDMGRDETPQQSASDLE